MANKKLTYAQVADKITKKIGKLEEDIKNGDRFAKASAKKMLPRLEAKKEQLFQHQEQSKQAAFEQEQGALMQKYGMGGPVGGYDLQRQQRMYANGGNPPTLQDMYSQYPGYSDMELQTMYERAVTKWNDLQNRNKLSGQPYSEPIYLDADSNPNITGNEVYPSAATRADVGPTQNVYRRHDADAVTAADGNTGYINRVSGEQSSVGGDHPYAYKDKPYVPPTVQEKKHFSEDYTSFPGADQGFPDQGQGQGRTPGDYLGMAATYAPTIYNTIRGLQKPAQEAERKNLYEADVMDRLEGLRYDIDPQLDANKRSFAATRKSIGQAAGGDASSYLATLGSAQTGKMRGDAELYAQKNNMENQYKIGAAQAKMQFGERNAAEKIRRDQVNAQNLAARNAYMGAATTGLSQAYQNEQRLANLRDADLIRANTLQNIYGDYGYSTDDRGRITGETYYKGNRGYNG